MSRKLLIALAAAVLGAVTMMVVPQLETLNELLLLVAASLLVFGLVFGRGLSADPRLVAVSAAAPPMVTYMYPVIFTAEDATMWPLGAIAIVVWALMVYAAVALRGALRAESRKDRSA